MEIASKYNFVMIFGKKKNRREEQRVTVNAPATLKVLTGAAGDLQVTLVDVSPKGAGLQTPEFVMRGLTVEVVWAGGAMRGKVQYCRPAEAGAGYQLGLRLD